MQGHSVPNPSRNKTIDASHDSETLTCKRSIPATKSLYNLMYNFIAGTLTLEDTMNGDCLGFTKLQVSRRLRLPHTNVFFLHDRLFSFSDYQLFVRNRCRAYSLMPK